MNKPIFVVGSPRSGTSILTWCLGQHPDIFPVPESNWMGDFAVNLEICYQIGAARGNRSLLSAMDIQRNKFFAHFGRSINALILQHRADLDRRRRIEDVQRRLKERGFYDGEVSGELNADTTGAIREYQISNHLEASGQMNAETLHALEIKGSESTSKARWVDGTPEYSLHIYALRQLFPDALFVHILRDVTSVVRSMLNFYRVAGMPLVANEEEAYRYWLRTVRACLKAEEAYGPRVVCRLRYTTLVENPESALRSLLDFVGEPYSGKCLEPLSQRINSSNVPDDFTSEDSATDPVIIEEAMRLSRDLQHGSQPAEASAAATAEMEAAFDERVHYMTSLDSQSRRALSKPSESRNELQPQKTTFC
jgi:peptidoglycan hydrolase-like protein with peptidoglycan-binding domain